MNTLTAPSRARFPRFADAPDTYTALCSLHLPRPIHNGAEARTTAAVVESLPGFPSTGTKRTAWMQSRISWTDTTTPTIHLYPPATARLSFGTSWTNTA